MHTVNVSSTLHAAAPVQPMMGATDAIHLAGMAMIVVIFVVVFAAMRGGR